jgi:hypothetical protein
MEIFIRRFRGFTQIAFAGIFICDKSAQSADVCISSAFVRVYLWLIFLRVAG